MVAGNVGKIQALGTKNQKILGNYKVVKDFLLWNRIFLSVYRNLVQCLNIFAMELVRDAK